MNYLIQLHGEMQGSDGLLRRVPSGGTPVLRENVEPELEHKARRVSEKFSENLHIIANEPSLAFFRIQEHVRKSLPQLVEQKHEVQEIQQNVQGVCFDAEYAKNAVNSMQNSRIHFQNIQDLLKNAMFMKQQIEYEESRKKQEKRHPSMYFAGSSSTNMTENSDTGSSSGGVMNTSCTDSSDSSMTQSGSGQPRSHLRGFICDDFMISLQRSRPIPRRQASLQSVAAHPANSVPVKFNHSMRTAWE